jgi:plasmid stability protein
MTLTIDLPEEEVTLLNAKAGAEGLSAEQCARQLLRQALSSPEARRPLPARIREIWADMPEEVRAKLPADGADQHDHYIYGVPKRAE